jgi:hypothetical protein
MRVAGRNKIKNLVALVVSAVLAGVVVAAGAFPLVAGSGLAAKAGARSFEELPSSFTLREPPEATRVYAADGKTLIATFFDQNRQDVALADVAPTMAQALAAAEDQNFYEHNGVDVRGLVRAAVVNQATAPNQRPSSASANSRTPTPSRSAPCTTGPTTTSGCTCSPACSPRRSHTSRAATPTNTATTTASANCSTPSPASKRPS